MKYWNRWIGLAGDVVIRPMTQAHIHDGIDAHVLERTGKVSSATLKFCWV